MGGDVTGNIDGGDDERVHEWEAGLPNLADLAPLTQGLIPPELLSAFNILPEPFRTSGDVSRASEDTISVLRGDSPKPLDETLEAVDEEEEIDEDDDEAEESDSKKVRRNESPEDADSSAAAKAIKRPRLVWTAQLHKRFVDVVAHLGIKNAVPKTIMQLMNVEGLTRENVASHLQKYRLYLKRMQGVSYDPPSNSSEKLFTSSPAPGTSPENVNGNVPVQIPVPYGQPMMPMPIPMPMMGMVMGMGMGMGMGNYNGLESNQNHHNQNNNQLNHHHHHHHHNHYHHHHQYNGIMQAGSNKYGSVMTYQQHHPPHVPPGNK